MMQAADLRNRDNAPAAGRSNQSFDWGPAVDTGPPSGLRNRRRPICCCVTVWHEYNELAYRTRAFRFENWMHGVGGVKSLGPLCWLPHASCAPFVPYRAIRSDILHFSARVLANTSSEAPESSHAPLGLHHPALVEVAATAATVMIEACLQRIELCVDMTIGSAILSGRRVTSDTQNGEVFLAPPLEAGSHRLAPRLSLLTSSIWTSSTFNKKYSLFVIAWSGSWHCFGSWSC